MNEVHGHEVMEMMIESNKRYTKESLEQEIISRFGDDTRFYTCSAKNLSASELIEFLDVKGKFIQDPDGFSTDAAKICDH